MELALAGLEAGDANDFVVIIANNMIITPFVLFMVSFPGMPLYYTRIWRSANELANPTK